MMTPAEMERLAKTRFPTAARWMTALANEMGVTENTVYRWHNGAPIVPRAESHIRAVCRTQVTA